jgi:hypothetical protein
MKVLGIDGAVRMIVQIGALGHAFQEVIQSKGVVADALELMHRALGGSLCLFRRFCRGCCRDQSSCNAYRDEGCRQHDPKFAHDPRDES